MLAIKGVAAVSLAALVLAMTPASGRAAADGNVDAASTVASNPAAEAVGSLALAQQLADLARSRKDPLLLIAAAKLTKEANARDAKREKASEAVTESEAADPAAPPKGAAPAQAAPALPRTDQDAVGKLLNEARGLAGDRKELLALIDDVGRVTRGAIGGPKRNYDWVNARGADIYDIPFRAGEVAAIGVITGGNPYLHLQVYDENGHLICNDRYNGSTSMLCRWVPRWAGNFRIKIRNRSYSPGEYVLVTN